MCSVQSWRPQVDTARKAQRRPVRQTDLPGLSLPPRTARAANAALQPLAEEEPSSDEEDESTRLPMQFDLGRFCAKRTRTYHQFTHWKVSPPFPHLHEHDFHEVGSTISFMLSGTKSKASRPKKRGGASSASLTPRASSHRRTSRMRTRSWTGWTSGRSSTCSGTRSRP